jgi:hypothetical protein
MSDARVIYDVSVTMGLPQRAAVIAEATAMQESRLVNLPNGTSDGLGLFQQRPSHGWDTPAQIMRPVYASMRFYEALVNVPGWQSLPLTVAAQAAQDSANPGAYAKWESLADSTPCPPVPRRLLSPPLHTPPPSPASPTSSLGVLAVRSRSIPMFAQLRRLMSVTLAVQRVWCKQLLILSSGVSWRRRSCMR